MPFTLRLYKCIQVILNLLLIFQLCLLSLSLYTGGCCCLQPLTGLFATQASLYLIPPINRGFFFFHMPTFFPLSDTVRRGFTVEQTLLIYPGYFFPCSVSGCCKSESSTQAMLPHAWQPVLPCYQPYTARVSSLCLWALIRL